MLSYAIYLVRFFCYLCFICLLASRFHSSMTVYPLSFSFVLVFGVVDLCKHYSKGKIT
jgi:hypothetical protein